MNGTISVEQLSFRYDSQQEWLFKDVSLTIEAGEHVAIVGPSGCGKSTFLKVLTGLYRPTGGRVFVDGKSLDEWGPPAIRQALGIVMQEDELFAGSIADNVSFFDRQLSLDRVWECLTAAGIANEIEEMPLGTETPVGDMGSVFSGGQKQRLLIARALYRKPKILILDEATSHLDVERERTIAKTLQNLRMTRVIVAHRAETINAADRVLHFQNRALVEKKVNYDVFAAKLET